MDPMTILQTAAILLLLTAAGGGAMAVWRTARKANPPHWLAMAHGLLAASGLTLLIYSAANGVLPGGAVLGLLLLLAAAAGGVVMNLLYHHAGKLLPHWLLVLHLALAALGTGLISWGAWAG